MSTSLLLHFGDENRRASFMREFASSWRELSQKSHLAENLPDLILDNLNPEEVNFIRKLAKDKVEIYEDVRFELFTP